MGTGRCFRKVTLKRFTMPRSIKAIPFTAIKSFWILWSFLKIEVKIWREYLLAAAASHPFFPFIQPARAGLTGLHAESTRAVIGRQQTTGSQWGGGRLFGASTGFFKKMAITGEHKIVTNVGNEPSLRGLQTGRWPKLGSYGENGIFWPKTEILGPKKNHFCTLIMFWPWPEKYVQRKKLPFPK